MFAAVIIIYDGLDLLLLTMGLLLLICVYGIVTIQNDIADYDTDTVNHRVDIPLSNKLIQKNDLEKFMIALIVLSVLISLAINTSVLLWVAIYTFLGWLYSGPAALKNKSYYALLVLGLCYGVLPWILGYVVINSTPDSIALVIILSSFLFVSGIISLKDFKDMRGDRITGKRTVLVAQGSIFTHKLIYSLTSLSYVPVVMFAMLTHNFLLIAVGLVLLIFNLYLLTGKSLLLSGKQRAKRGRLARATFYSYAILTLFLYQLN